ncbi:unnamed protein product [Paramecium sonneborni]|uniref:Uncharacterized protein n=1 Tax=Paramecium sonneborni TaxID=65129 RepID=A0A8S1RUZ4_9CILI|nr:unnamed protein product [Paramecium sonneborni]
MLQSTIQSGLVEQVEIYLSYDCKSSEKLQYEPSLWMIPLANVSIYSFTIFKSTIVVQFNLEFLCLNQTLEIIQEIQCYDTQIIELINNLIDKLLTYLKIFEQLNFEDKIDNYFEFITNNKEKIMEYFQTQFHKDVSNQLRIKKNMNEIIQTENFPTLTFNYVEYQKNKSQLLNSLIETQFIDQTQNINLDNYITQDSSQNIANPQREQNLFDSNQITQKADDEITEIKQTHPNKISQGNQKNQEEKDTNFEENIQLDLYQKNDFNIFNELNQILQEFLNQYNELNQILQTFLKIHNKNYRALFKKADQDLKNFWMLYPQHKVNCMKGNIIVLDIVQKAENIISFGEILIALTFLKQKFEIIFLGSSKSILSKDENRYINEDKLQKILHAMGGYQNSSFPFYNNTGRQQYNYIILFDFKNKILELSQKCKSELYQE